MISIIIGIVMLIGGLSGQLVLRGTNSSVALVVVSIIVIIRGIYQMSQNKKEQDSEYYMNSEDSPAQSSFSNLKVGDKNEPEKLVCPNCGATSESAVMCKYCGTRMK